jgi:pSer/pThr/pTyr-binding forkhead associated (FHA) protein
VKRPPAIIVQIVHIQGPSKGEILEFSKDVISIGRHPTSDVRFPADLATISRNHAEIVRAGNQFKLMDHSTNGTFINGKRITEALLRDGDVIELADGGPKVSFLTQMKEEPLSTDEPFPPLEKARTQGLQAAAAESVVAEPRAPAQASRPEKEIIVQRTAVPLVVQYGPTIRSFKELPVTIGKHPRCDFVLEGSSIFDQHAQIFFSSDQYWVKDLTGQRLVQVNKQPINFQSPLALSDNIALTPQGPVFRFIGEGRLAEVAEPAPEEGPMPSRTEEGGAQGPDAAGKKGKGILSRFKKLF